MVYIFYFIGSFAGQKKMSTEVFVKVRHYNVYYIQASM